MIEIKNVSKSYTKGKKSVDSLNLTINNGEIFGFLGPNGAGKTTTIKMITGILDADEGEILIDGYDIDKQPMEAKRQFGFVPDNPDIFLSLKAIEYLNFLCDIYDVVERENKIVSLTKKFEIYDVLNNKLESFSHGMRQKIVLIGALLHNPNNWILDEPMTGLDPKSSFDLKEMMKEHADEGKTVFFSTHVLEVAEKMCDRIGIISKGKLLFVGTVEEAREQFAKEGSLEKVFLEITENA
ncbi:MAG TPA: ABC transporter ATP-binding protein [Erysipelotrichaceae bacterium]|jgi:ABC-2 type transport system ATP-binding protein|nr:ABC transporter ATP-binding protein [Erysipelotrichaceae bacterium]HQA85590.1 ABC transporter ATP-binding protein [Erysipelotrichaceae bacterium]